MSPWLRPLHPTSARCPPCPLLPPGRLAFVAILVGGFAGGLIGYTLVRLQCDGNCDVPKGLGALFGAVIAALGMSDRRRAGAPGTRRVAPAQRPGAARRQAAVTSPELGRARRHRRVAGPRSRSAGPRRPGPWCAPRVVEVVGDRHGHRVRPRLGAADRRAAGRAAARRRRRRRGGHRHRRAERRALADRPDRRHDQLPVRPGRLHRVDRRTHRCGHAGRRGVRAGHRRAVQRSARWRGAVQRRSRSAAARRPTCSRRWWPPGSATCPNAARPRPRASPG